ncbi:MAG: 30S ribosomal protein S6 [Chloroflexota bacterium]|nr:MAG: 30S ribosomal protein S6 [Chloroflexota bacterium]
MSNYELTYVLRPLEEANLTATTERVNTIIRNAGGEIVARNDWGRRRLAYPIRKNNDGYYTTLFVQLPGSAVRGIERALQLNDDVLRYLVVRVEEFRLPTPPPAETPVVSEPAPVEPAPVESAPTEPAPSATTEPSAEAVIEPVAEATNESAPVTAAEG